jgi:hypothetical protein
MEISTRDLWTVLHGMGFGALFMLAFTGALVGLFRMSTAGSPAIPNPRDQMMLRLYLIGMVVLAWAAVFSGAYVVYPWYRAVPPAGTIDLANYPRYLLLSKTTTAEWHHFGMEWKEHVAWIAPIAMTMVAYVFGKYGPTLAKHRNLRNPALIFALAAFVATGVAGGFGAFLNKYAPIHGGETIQVMKGK